jgi:hypothetical protein
VESWVRIYVLKVLYALDGAVIAILAVIVAAGYFAVRRTT